MSSRENRFDREIGEDLCSFDPISASSISRLPHDCHMIIVGRLTSREHLDKLAKIVADRETSDDEEATMETEEIEHLLEYITLDNKSAIEEHVNGRGNYVVYEEYFNSALFHLVEAKASFTQLRDVCRRYETRGRTNMQQVMNEYQHQTASLTPYFIGEGLSLDDAQGAAFALTFYTGSSTELISRRVISRGAPLIQRVNRQIIKEKTEDEMNEAVIILFYLVKALSCIPSYWGYVIRDCQLTDNELELYMPGCLITWTQFSYAQKCKIKDSSFKFSFRNTLFHIYSLTSRSIRNFVIGEDYDDVLLLPYSTFFVLKHQIIENGAKHIIYMRQVELGLSEWSVLWVDDKIFHEYWENIRHMESTTTKESYLNIHFIPKSSTESALAFLRSPFGQRLKNKDTFRIVTSMNSNDETSSDCAGVYLIKNLRQLGFTNQCLIYTYHQKQAEENLEKELNSNEMTSIKVTDRSLSLEKFINFEN